MPNYITMTKAINLMVSPASVLQQLFFPNATYKMVSTPSVTFDVIKGKRRIAPLCSVYDEAKRIYNEAYETRTYNLPHISLKDFISTYDLTVEKLAGTNHILPEGMSLKDLVTQKIAEKQLKLKNSIINRVELMVAQQLTGIMDVTGENVNYRIDLNMSSENKPVLTGTAKWDGSAADIIKNIRTWKRRINRATGNTADIGVLGYEAADKFIANPDILKALNNNNYKAGTLNIEGLDYLGKFMSIDWYERSEQYVNAAGDDVEFIDPKVTILHASKSEKTMYWGAVYDEEATSLMPIFSKEKIQDDPSGRTIYAKSSPLPVFNVPDATVYATVL